MTRFEFSNHLKITKVDKSEYSEIKKSIFWIFQKLGKTGTTAPVAYDTAFAARVPLANDLNHPAFPQCLQWLRDHQTQDGVWGEDYPPSIHSKILNTLAATLALSQWRQPQDQERLEKGVGALVKMGESLPMEKTESRTFEMILSSLVDDARQLDLNILYESYEWFAQVGREAVKSIQQKLLTNKPNKHWVLLEAAGKTLDLHPIYYRAEIKRHGIIAAQPSTTAFILRQARLRGEDYIEAEWALERLSSESNGGLPHFYHCDNFEMIYGLDFLTKVGINPNTNDKHEAARNSIETLRERWDFQNGIGFSSTWQFSDCSCNEVAVSVLNTTSDKKEDGFYVTKTKKHRSDCEMHSKKYKQLQLAKLVDQPDIKSLSCIKPPYQNDEPLPCSIYNTSKYYNVMCKVFEASLDTTKIVHMIDEIVKSQNKDGGWGGKGTSSAEETAYVCLAMFVLTRHNSQILHNINFINLIQFIQDSETPSKNDSLWYWKVSFLSPGLAEVAIAAAKYAVFQMQRICIMTDVLNDSKLDLEEIEILDGDSLTIFRGYNLRSDKNLWPKNNENKEEVLKDLEMNFFKGDSPGPYFQSIINDHFEFIYLQNPAELPIVQRMTYFASLLCLQVVDDIVDYYLPDKDDVLDKLEAFSSTIIAVFEGIHHDPENVPAYDYPEFDCFLKLLFFVQHAIQENGWDRQYFVGEVKKYFNASVSVHKDLYNNIEPTAKRYLQIHKISSGLKPLVHVSCMISRIESSPETENLDECKKFMDIASKACRIIADYFSVPKDTKIFTLDNYCLKLQHQYNLSVQEAVQMAVKKSNKEILKMHTLKAIIQNDPKYENYRGLSMLIKYGETFVEAASAWILFTSRYKSNWTIKSKSIRREKQDFTFVRNLSFDQ